MTWKIFMMLCISGFIISFPQNIIGCGPGIDPYDYYTSFFQNDIANNRSYEPFYYTGYNFLYDDQEPVKQEDLIAGEWATYCGKNVTEKDAKQFVMQYAYKDLSNLYYNIEKGKPLSIPDSMKRNSMTSYFISSKNLEGLGYLMYAKRVEPSVCNTYDEWDPAIKDSVKMDKLMNSGQKLYTAAKTDFFKLKYGYQVLRLAHYNNHSADAVAFYDQYIAPVNSNSILKQLSLALKAGALFRIGNGPQAAYLFSKVFAETDVKKISNYLSFGWSVEAAAGKEKYLALCKDNTEKADMLALFTFSNPGNALQNLEEIAQLNPEQKALPTLVAREVNKLEETLLTPKLQTENGGKAFYYTWNDTNTDSAVVSQNNYAGQFVDFLKMMAAQNNAKAGFYHLAAGYTNYMRRELVDAKAELLQAKKLSLSPVERDQYSLTDLLILINEQNNITPQFEQEILPSVKWLQQKAVGDKVKKIGYYSTAEWKIFYRNFFSEILSRRYHAQKDFYKEALCIGAAEKISSMSETEYGYTPSAVNFMQDKLSSADVEQLYTLMTNTTPSAFEQYLLKNNTIKKYDVVDFAGTAYLRNNDYEKALEWFAKAAPAKAIVIAKNPFIDLLYDREEKLPKETATTTKQSFASEMLRLQKLIVTDKANAAKYYYKIGLGLYNMSYYGHAWELVAYWRSGSDGYAIPHDATAFQKEYYGVVKAEETFKKAMANSADKNFKARCLFMMAKCSQKRAGMPKYEDFPNYDAYEQAEKNYFPSFKKNSYFPQFVKEYSGTSFYKTAMTSCSYLREFVKTNK